ncbi:MAG TPA: glycerol kinase GlpK [Planctomycetaceae bacterium]|nr:glycerol kinase GlpK [Planctomycetaceae bacterium]
MTKTHVLALDQGTTSSRAMVFDRSGRAVGTAQQEFPQLFPSPGHVEHDPEAIWSSQLATAQQALTNAKLTANDIAAIGVTNQRETTIVWERDSGQPVANAIVWQSRITAPICERMKAEGLEPLFRERTGLVLDAYFSGTKIRHLLDTIPGLRERAERGDVLFGTVDSFLIWRLTGGKRHVTDVSNASRTLLFNLHTLAWDDELLKLMGVPRAMLPDVVSSSEIVGECDAKWFGGAIPIAGVAGDQQAATFGQACFDPGSVKNTYGTGCFMLLNTGEKPAESKNGLLTTVGWRINDRTTYCLEGAVFIAGAAVQWLRDGLGLIRHASETAELASSLDDNGGVYFVPAFVGLGAPHWDADARGTIVGLTRGTTKAHLARAALEAMAYQTRDVLDAMREDSGIAIQSLRVDGGATANNWLMQFQADVLGVPVSRPVVPETTALGAAYLAGLATGVWLDARDIVANWQLQREFLPSMPESERSTLVGQWRRAVERARG